MGGFSGVRFDAESSALVLFGLGYVGPDFGVSFRTGPPPPGGIRMVKRQNHNTSPEFGQGRLVHSRRDVPVSVPLDLSTQTGMSCIRTYGEICKSDIVSKYCVLLVAFLL